jgi:hypothetical protein
LAGFGRRICWRPKNHKKVTESLLFLQVSVTSEIATSSDQKAIASRNASSQFHDKKRRWQRLLLARRSCCCCRTAAAAAAAAGRATATAPSYGLQQKWAQAWPAAGHAISHAFGSGCCWRVVAAAAAACSAAFFFGACGGCHLQRCPSFGALVQLMLDSRSLGRVAVQPKAWLLLFAHRCLCGCRRAAQSIDDPWPDHARAASIASQCFLRHVLLSLITAGTAPATAFADCLPFLAPHAVAA